MGNDPGEKAFRSGFAALLGSPNVGKSTLLNRMIGEKISITSPRPQTTRNRILGVVHKEDAQIIVLDTPGIHHAKSALNRHIVQVAVQSAGDVDVILFVLDASRPDPDSEALVLAALKAQKVPVILVINKIDLIKKEAILPMLDTWRKTHVFSECIPLSAKLGDQVDILENAIAHILPKGPRYFPEDHITDVPERFLAAEMIREKVFRLTSQEIPYSTAVTIESFKEEDNPPLVRIHAAIHVERDSQKGIIIGKKGAQLKKIGTQARQEIERMLAVQVFLKLFVRVEKNWSTDTKAMRRLGYD